jgi:hypothetical protein
VITPATLTITANSGQSKTYGTNDAASGFTYSAVGLYAGDTVTGNLGRAAGETVGNYTYSAGSLSAGGNYTSSVIAGTGITFAITPATLTINPIAGQSAVSGTSDPVFSYTLTGLVNGVTPSYWNSAGSYVAAASAINDTLSGNLSRAAGVTPGSYPYVQGSITVSAPSNYSININAASDGFTIIAAPNPVSPTAPIISLITQNPNTIFLNTTNTSSSSLNQHSRMCVGGVGSIGGVGGGQGGCGVVILTDFSDPNGSDLATLFRTHGLN